jgi:phosphorylase kinase alpha/beta subunit
MEDWALYNSSYVICAIVFIIGLALIIVPPPLPPASQGQTKPNPGQEQTHAEPGPEQISFWQKAQVQGGILMASAMAGAFFAKKIEDECKLRVSGLEKEATTLAAEAEQAGIDAATRAAAAEQERLRTEQTRSEKAKAARNRKTIAALSRPSYTADDLECLHGFLAGAGCFVFPSLPSGLFPAAASAGTEAVSGYQYVWVRDNVHIANAHYVCGDLTTARRTASALMRHFQKQEARFHGILKDPTLKSEPMNRPRIRFDGNTGADLAQEWPHDQNDALGYFLWFCCKLAGQGLLELKEPELKTLALFPAYFEKIQYWEDKDSGHWEETPKVSASSIGTVVAGLSQFKHLAEERKLWSDPALSEWRVSAAMLERLVHQGRMALERILPCESVEPEACYRRYDSALLFLIYPLEVLTPAQAERVLADVTTHLQGEHGIRRYLGDSYWSPDYKEHMSEKERTAPVGKDSSKRDQHAQPGKEAQWCIFDSIISVAYGREHLLLMERKDEPRARKSLRLQTHYLNRALSQLTDGENGQPAFCMPEAYYLEKGRYVPNDHTPLLWSQANLWLAIHQMRRSCSASTAPA